MLRPMKPKFTTSAHRQTCIDQAKANAEWFGAPYAVMQDTSGNWRVERLNPNALYPYEVFQPSELAKQAKDERDQVNLDQAERHSDSLAGDTWGAY